MPKKPESALYRRLAENLPNCRISRIESTVNLGFPDCVIGFRPGVFVLLELKVVRRGKKVDLRPHQVAFHLSHAEYGCPTFLLVQYYPPPARVEGRLLTKASELLLYRGDQVMELLERGVDTAPVSRWPWTGVMWNMLAQELLTS